MKGRVYVNKKKIFVLVLVMTLMLTGCGQIATLENGEEVVAKLDGKTITAEDLYSELKKQGGAVTLTNMIDNFIVGKEIKTDDDAESYADSQILAQGVSGGRTIVYYIWNYGIGNNAKFGLASAASVFLALVIIALSIIQFSRNKMFKKVR